MSIARFKSNKAKVAAGLRPVRFKDDGTMHVLTDMAAERFSEIYLDGGTVTPPPVDPIEPPAPIDPPPVVVVAPPVSGITPANFAANLAAAKSGDTLLLGPGKYPNPARVQFIGNVTIKAATPHTASFATLNLNACEGITFDSIAMDYTWQASDYLWQNPFFLLLCKRITFKDCRFAGSGDATGHGVGRGLTLDLCSDITVDGGSVTRFMIGILVDTCQNIVIEDAEVKTMASDGIDVAATQGIRIERCWIHDFKTPPEKDYHCDAIQFWTSQTKRPGKDIIIRGNRIDVGAGSYLQSIFMRNEEVDLGRQSFAVMAYVNVLIENNTIWGTHIHGITVGEAAGMTVRNNAVIHKPANPADPENAVYLQLWPAQSAIMVPIISIDLESTGVSVTGNAFAGATWYAGPRVNGVPTGNNATYASEAAIPAGVGA